MIRRLTIAFLIALPALAADGPALFKQQCIVCHGPKGNGNTPAGKSMKVQDLGSAEVQKRTDDELAAVITKGKGKMPAFPRLAPGDVKALVGVIRSLRKVSS
ncbi:MAG TPA: cytochrome c [Thermoanaerobaculia bacterium]|jgi:mono/diheme cytochrome c family protein|nr:cytochrome c [Thermoanaerobaculia bacterium]